MKVGLNKVLAVLILCLVASPAFAFGTLIATALALTGTAATVAAFVINIAVSMIISKLTAPDLPSDLAGASQNPGNRQTVSPATDSKLPVVYGSAWVGGTIVDMSISTDNQWLFWVIALSEVTDNGNDLYTIPQVYFGGRKCIFDSTNTYKVTALQDPSTLVNDSACSGNLYVYLYRNGTDSNINSPYTAYQVMQGFNPTATSTLLPMTYRWANGTVSQKMTNTCFAIVQMKYSQSANLTGMQQMKFQVINPRNAPGDCFQDYLTNTVYGAGLTINQIDTTSLTALNTYSAGAFTYTDSTGSHTQNRFQFNGVINTVNNIMDNLQQMATSCDCLIKYNEVLGLWGVIVQQPTYTVAMALNDSNLLGGFNITPLDISASYNIIECKYPEVSSQDSFNSATFDLTQLAPQLMYPNEPINKQSVTLSLVNNSVTAQYIANRLLEAGREDLTITCRATFTGIQLEAGDVVTVTSANYGWDNKLFRVNKITEIFESTGSITAELMLSEFNPQIFDDLPITAFEPSPNTGLPNALSFGTLAAPQIISTNTIAPIPYVEILITAPTNGIAQYAEIYRSASSTGSGAIFLGTTEVKPSGNPYASSEQMPPVYLTGIPAGNWYFFYKIVNDLGKSALSAASTVVNWRPMTFTYSNKYLMLAYADSITGTNISYNPRNKSHFGIRSSDSIINSLTASDYTWYPASPTFSTANYLIYALWGNRTISFATGAAAYYGGATDQGYFVSIGANYPSEIWSANPDPASGIQSYINIDQTSGQNILTGSTSNYGSLAIQPSTNGKLEVALNKFLNFGVDGSGSDILQKTLSPAYLTVDIFGRVVGFEYPDNFYITIQNYTATSGQTVFTTTRDASYKINNCLVFENGILVDTSEYTDTAGSTGTVTFSTGRTLNDRITIISFRSYHLATAGAFVIGTTYTIVSTGSTSFTAIGAANNNPGTTFTATGVGSGTGTAYTIYNSFSRFTQSVTAVNSITPTNPISSGFEYLFFNGVALLDPDYDIDSTGNIINLPAQTTGVLTCIQWAANNLTVANGNPYVILANTVNGQATYNFGFTPNAFNLHENGVLLISGTDYTTASGAYTLSPTPTSSANFLLQQSFSRTGAA